MRYFKNVMTFGTALSGLVVCTNEIGAAQISALQEVQAIHDLAPAYQAQTTDPVSIVDLDDTQSDMDNLIFGAATATNPSYWYLDGSNNLFAQSSVGNVWRTYRASSVPASWSASGNLVLTESVNDGATPGSPTYTLTIILTKVGTIANLTQAQLGSFLSTATVTSLAAANTGTALTATGVIVGTATNGWLGKAWGSASNGTTPAAFTLDPMSMTLNWATTTSGGSALNFTTSLNNLHTWNLATNSTTTESVVLTVNGRSLSLSVLPAQLTRTSATAPGIASSLLYALTNSVPKKLDVTTKSFLSDIPSGISLLRTLTQSSPSGSEAVMFQSLAQLAVASSHFVIGGFTTKADTNNYGLVSLTSSSLSSLSWSVDNKSLIATGKIGASGQSVPFTCDLTGIKVVKAGTNEVLKFLSADGQFAFWVKTFDSTGLDTSGVSTIPASSQDNLLAMQLLNKLSSTATISALTLNGFISAIA